jgi:hypothetical protein
MVPLAPCHYRVQQGRKRAIGIKSSGARNVGLRIDAWQRPPDGLKGSSALSREDLVEYLEHGVPAQAAAA